MSKSNYENHTNDEKEKKTTEGKKTRAPRTPGADKDYMKNIKNTMTKRFNVFIIREIYVYMAKIDRVPNATKRLYKYLGVDADYYDHMVQTGAGDINRIKEKFIECGFSDTLFRTDSPTLIKTSQALEEKTEDYLADEKKCTLEEYRDFLEAEIGSIRNPDNSLLVVATRNLLNKVVQASEPTDTLLHFLDLLDDVEFEGHYLQKDMSGKLQDIYNEYLELLENNKNQTEK